MSTSWRINNLDLTTGTVNVIVDQQTDVQDSTTVRRQRERILHATEEGHHLGKDKRRVKFRFTFVGGAPARYTRMKAVRELLEDEERVTIQAPDSPNELYIFDDLKVAELETDSLTLVHHGGLGAVSLDVQGVLSRYQSPGGIGMPAVGEAAVGEERELL